MVFHYFIPPPSEKITSEEGKKQSAKASGVGFPD